MKKIDANDFRLTVERRKQHNLITNRYDPAMEDEFILSLLDTQEEVPEKIGGWLEREGDPDVKCSACGKKPYCVRRYPKYCPNCGAKMLMSEVE